MVKKNIWEAITKWTSKEWALYKMKLNLEEQIEV